MEILPYNTARGGCLVELRSKVLDEISCSRRLKVAGSIGCKLFSSRMDFGDGLVVSLNNLKSPISSSSNVTSRSYNGYVIGSDEDVSSVSEEGSISKVPIPGLPENSNGGELGPSISSCFWEWKPKLNVHYEKTGCKDVKLKSPPILFLPGFGVGSFHYEKQLRDLGRDYRVWALDFLGQGMSLPCEDPTPQPEGETGGGAESKGSMWGFGEETEQWACELVFSMDLWRGQVRYFVEEVCISHFISINIHSHRSITE